MALTAVALLSGPAFVVPELRAGAALLAMSVGGGVLSYLFWNAGIAKLGPTICSGALAPSISDDLVRRTLRRCTTDTCAQAIVSSPGAHHDLH